MEQLLDFKTEKVSGIIKERCGKKFKNLLVVGCGSGREAATLAFSLKAGVVGIDIEHNFDQRAMRYSRFSVGDATSLAFNDATFDFVYSYHALEHIHNPMLALQEMKRVLKDGGGYFIGAPNRSRLLGYIGSSDATAIEKVRWNLIDWKARIQGRFQNQYGAHAGFTAYELNAMLQEVFSRSEDITKTYYRTIYSNKIKILSLIEMMHLSALLCPSIYFTGTR